MSDLAIYDRMCFAIAECHRVDEVKNLRDKAQALELYARQCKNTEAERQAANVRLRAERQYQNRRMCALFQLPGRLQTRPHRLPDSPLACG